MSPWKKEEDESKVQGPTSKGSQVDKNQILKVGNKILLYLLQGRCVAIPRVDDSPKISSNGHMCGLKCVNLFSNHANHLPQD